MKIILIAIIVLWIACGVVSWGLMYAFFTRRFQLENEGRVDHIINALVGPVALLVSLCFLAIISHRENSSMFKYGFKL